MVQTVAGLLSSSSSTMATSTTNTQTAAIKKSDVKLNLNAVPPPVPGTIVTSLPAGTVVSQSPQGTVINFTLTNADLVQRACTLSSQHVSPSVATITLTRDMRNDAQLNAAVQKPIIVTVSGIPGITTGVRPQLTPISVAGPPIMSIPATVLSQTSPDKLVTCPTLPLSPVPNSTCSLSTAISPVTNPMVVTTVAASSPTPKPSTLAPIAQSLPVVTSPTTLFVSPGPQFAGKPTLTVIPSSSPMANTFVQPASLGAVITPSSMLQPTSTATVTPVAVTSSTTPVVTVSSVPTPIPVVMAPSVSSPNAIMPPVIGPLVSSNIAMVAVPPLVTSPQPTSSSISLTSPPSKADPNNADFDPIKAMDWKDGIGTLPGTNMKFRLTEFDTLEVITDDLESPSKPEMKDASTSDKEIQDDVPMTSSSTTVSPSQNLNAASQTEISIKEEIETPIGSPKLDTSNDNQSEEILRCLSCGCHGLRSEFCKDGRFCSQLCYMNFASKENIKKQREELIKQKKRKFNSDTDGDKEKDDESQSKKAKLDLKSQDGPKENGSDSSGKCQQKVKIKHFSWSEYLEKEKATAAQSKLFKDPFPTGKNGFRVGMKLEGIDPRHPSLFCVLSVAEVQGYRVRLHFDGYSDCYDYWVNADSGDIFPVGWCEKTGHKLYPPKSYTPQEFNWATYLKQTKAPAAPKQLFKCKEVQQLTPHGFRVGSKLEAVDRKNNCLVCVASVADVMDGRFLIHFDGWESSYDYWADPGSPYIHPVSWCEENSHNLTPPNKYKNPDSFSWSKYLSETKSQAVPARAFKPRLPNNFQKGMKLEAVDPRNPKLIRVATLADAKPHSLKVHFDGWNECFDFWVEDDSPDIHPINWCLKTNHPIEPPPDYHAMTHLFQGNCPTPGCKGVGHIKGPKYTSHHSAFGCPYSRVNMNKESPLPDRLGGYRSEAAPVEMPQVNNNNSESCAVEGLRKCPTPGCNGSGHLNQKYSVHYKASGCPLADKQSKSGSSSSSVEITNGDDCSQDSMHNTRTRGRPKKVHMKDLFRTKSETTENTKLIKQEESDPKFKELCNSVHNSVFTTVPLHDPNNELPLCWDHHSRIVPDIKGITSSEVAKWSTDDVVSFISKLPGCKDLARVFKEEQIDGEAFLLLNQFDLVKVLNFKLGPALKIYNSILLIQNCAEV